jgi:hypothetical protein
MTRSNFTQQRRSFEADRAGEAASGREAAARRRVYQARHGAGDGFQSGFPFGGHIDPRDRADQALRVGV